MINAFILTRGTDKIHGEVRSIDEIDLPDGDVTIDVAYSSVNYKDAMVIKGLGGMVRSYPHVPGIDFAGRVTESGDERFSPGDEVILTGHRVGEARWGGYAQRARVQGSWLVPLPGGLTARRAMALGTAGLTAMLGVMALRGHGIAPDGPPILVTGATGGVGSLSIMLLCGMGYTVHASTGKGGSHDYLRQLGAAEIINRCDLSSPPAKALDKQTWSGCIDSVGGDTLAHVLSKTAERGAVVSVGLVAGDALATSLTPFLLRGVNLLGIASTSCPMRERTEAWCSLAERIPMDRLDAITTETGLAGLPAVAERFLAGDAQGRTVVDVHT